MPPRTTPATAIAILCLGLPPGLAASPRASLPAPTLAVTFAPAHDARVESANPTTNYGSSELRIRSGMTIHTYLKFTVAGLGGPVDSARVRLFCNNESVDGGRIQPVANDYQGTASPWAESGLTWNSAPLLSGPVLDQKGQVVAGTWVEFDVTPAITGDSTYSFALSSNSTNIAGFHSKEGASPPELVILTRVAPAVTGFAPTHGAPGTEVTVIGSGFYGTSTVLFNGVPASSFVVDSDQQIRAVVPIGAKSGPISIVNAWGSGLSVGDFVLDSAVPELAFLPAQDARVEFANPATNYGSSSLLRLRSAPLVHSFLKFEVSGLVSSVANAKLRLFCNNESEDGGRIYSVSADYSGTPTPWVEGGLTWSNAPALAGPILDQVGVVTLDTWIEFDVTAAMLGNGVYSFGLASDQADIAGYSSKEGTRPPQLVIQQRPPTLTGFAPATAPVGAQVTVTGTDLGSTTAVDFGLVPAAFTVDSDTQLRATVPAGVASGPIRVTTPTGTAISAVAFALMHPPTINGFSPSGGLAGSEVTITGTSLGSVSEVDFHGTPAGFVIDNDTRLRATVPAGAGSGKIGVANPAGSTITTISFAVQVPTPVLPGLWTSAAELAGKPMSGPPWEYLLAAADTAENGIATITDQNSNNNVAILAAGIVFARTGDPYYRDVVARACDSLVAFGKPTGRSLPWARETGAYVLAADLVGYRTTSFEFWLRNMAEIWEGDDDRHLLEAFWERPNNWGANAFGTIAAIYGYLGDSARLDQIRDYWIQSVTGPNPGQFYADDLSWHPDPEQPRSINPPGSKINGIDVDGLIPDDMQRGGSFQIPPELTGYPWEHMQGLVMAARIFERRGFPIWGAGDDAIFRAAYAIQVRFEREFGGWKAENDDLWMLHFLDAAYGTNWSDEVIDERKWQAGKNCGWGYVVWNSDALAVEGRSDAIDDDFAMGPVVSSPVRESGWVRFQLARPGSVDLRVLDVTGRVVRVLAHGWYPSGAHRTEFPARGLASGMYFVRLDVSGTVRGAKVAVLR